MLTYIYLNLDDCYLTSSMPIGAQSLLNCAVIPNNVIFED